MYEKENEKISNVSMKMKELFISHNLHENWHLLQPWVVFF